MRYRKINIEYSPDYQARIFKFDKQTSTLDFFLHWHFDYEFVYVERGFMTLYKLDGQVELKAGALYFLNSEEVHCYGELSEDLKVTVLNFSPKAILPYLENPEADYSFDLSQNARSRRRIAGLIKGFNDYDEGQKRCEILRTKAILDNIYYRLIKDFLTSGSDYVKGSHSSSYNCAKDAIKYMNENYARDLPLAEIAQYIGMTPAHFSKYFKDKTGMNFSKQLRIIRLSHALDDITKENLTVKAAAEKNGFPNVNALIAACREQYGKTPTEVKSLI